MLVMVGPFGGFDQIESIQVEMAQNMVGGFDRKGPFSLQNIVNMGLRDANQASECPLGEFSAANTMPEN